MTRQINDAGLALIKDFEKLRLTAYDDGVGVWTIGWGSTKGVSPGMTITEPQAEGRLLADLDWAAKAVEASVKQPLNENQFAALVSFVFNVGVNAFSRSTLLSELNAGHYDRVPHELARWNQGGGKVLPGLVRRRAAEIELWEKAVP